MTLKIISSSDVLFQGDVTSVTLPGQKGSFTVLNNHASLISTLTPGTIRFQAVDGNEQTVEIGGGIADVDNNVVSVCVN